ncbi:MAG: CaiB/BaiF CoA transferase family protein [Peptococcaceae bacterium]
MTLFQGVRVLDATTVIAGPFAAGLLADFGADVIKIEMPKGGDPFRKLGPYYNNESVRWPSMGRNKRCVTLDLRKEEGKNIFLKMVAKSDLLIENFRTGTLERWGLDMETLKKANPDVIVVRITGYGQTGPRKDMAGFGTPATAYSGMTYITGYPDRPPVSPSFSLTDYISGLYAVIGAVSALYHRDIHKGPGQEVDVSLYEGIFRMMEILVADYHKNGRIKERSPKLSGSSSPGGTYQTKDGKWVVLVCSTDRTYEYLTNAMNRPDLLTDLRFNTMQNRLTNDKEMDIIVRDWIRSFNYLELQEIVDREGVPVSLVYNAEDIFNDPHYQSREDIVEMSHPNMGTIKMPGIFPKFNKTPGEIKWIGPELGAHNQEVYGELLDLDEKELQKLREKQVI